MKVRYLNFDWWSMFTLHKAYGYVRYQKWKLQSYFTEYECYFPSYFPWDKCCRNRLFHKKISCWYGYFIYHSILLTLTIQTDILAIFNTMSIHNFLDIFSTRIHKVSCINRKHDNTKRPIKSKPPLALIQSPSFTLSIWWLWY